MRLLSRGLTVILLFFINNCTFAQGSPVTPASTAPPPTRIDFTPGTKASFNLPYDSAFTLGIHYKTREKFYGASLIWLQPKEPLENALLGKSPLNDLDLSTVPDTGTAEVVNVEFRYNGKGSSGILKPGRRYALLLTSGLMDEVYDTTTDNKTIFTEFYHVFDPDDIVDSAKYKQAMIDYDYIRLKKKTGIIQTMDFGPDAFRFYQTTFYAIHKKYFALKGNIDQDQDIATLLTVKMLTNAEVCIKDFYKILESKACSCKNADSAACCDSICQVLVTLKALLLAEDSAAFKIVTAGSISLQELLRSPLDVKTASTVQQQMSNIAFTLRELIALKNALFRYMIDPTGIHCLDGFLTAAQQALVTRSANLAQLLQYRRQIYNGLTGGGRIHFSKLNQYNLNSYLFGFQTRTTLYFTPIFGYAVYKFGNTYDFSPYLGFQVNFQPMNQNIPFRLIRNKTLWQRLCFTTAWTLKSVSYPGKREDFFGGSSSLLTGIGFKLSHVVMINAGTLWFKALDPNPYSTEKHIVCVPALSLSLNLTIQNLLNGFTSLIPSL